MMCQGISILSGYLCVSSDGDDGDLAKFVKKKRITDHDFPPPLYVGGK